MELSIPANKIDIRNIYFMEKKKNVIVDGEFVKILYSTPEFEMNGLYIFSEFGQLLQRPRLDGSSKKTTQPHSPHQHQKKYIVFNPSTAENSNIINLLCQIESGIIFRYIQNKCPSKIASYTLKTQLINGIIKYHSENRMTNSGDHPGQQKERIILKIAGIWETTTHIGITMKFISLV